jgi:hypothetical protein
LDASELMFAVDTWKWLRVAEGPGGASGRAWTFDWPRLTPLLGHQRRASAGDRRTHSQGEGQQLYPSLFHPYLRQPMGWEYPLILETSFTADKGADLRLGCARTGRAVDVHIYGTRRVPVHLPSARAVRYGRDDHGALKTRPGTRGSVLCGARRTDPQPHGLDRQPLAT